jgi:hypothetical protein
MGGAQGRPTTCDPVDDGETVLPLRGSGDDAGDPEDPTNFREAVGAAARRDRALMHCSIL